MLNLFKKNKETKQYEYESTPKLNSFAVYDLKAEIHWKPFFANNREDAIRTFIDGLTADPMSQGILQLHPEDHILVDQGQYNQKTGQYEHYKEGNIVIAKGSDYIKLIEDKKLQKAQTNEMLAIIAEQTRSELTETLRTNTKQVVNMFTKRQPRPKETNKCKNTKTNTKG